MEEKLDQITHSWHPNHQNFVIYEYLFLTNFFLFFLQLLKTSFNWEYFCWLANKKFIFSAQSKHKKIDSWYFVERNILRSQNFGGLDATNELQHNYYSKVFFLANFSFVSFFLYYKISGAIFGSISVPISGAIFREFSGPISRCNLKSDSRTGSTVNRTCHINWYNLSAYSSGILGIYLCKIQIQP